MLEGGNVLIRRGDDDILRGLVAVAVSVLSNGREMASLPTSSHALTIL